MKPTVTIWLNVTLDGKSTGTILFLKDISSGIMRVVLFQLILSWKAPAKFFLQKALRYVFLQSQGRSILCKLEKTEDSHNGKSVFAKKRVVCEDEFEALLKEHHNQKNHLGFIKCYYEVPPCLWQLLNFVSIRILKRLVLYLLSLRCDRYTPR